MVDQRTEIFPREVLGSIEKYLSITVTELGSCYDIVARMRVHREGAESSITILWAFDVKCRSRPEGPHLVRGVSDCPAHMSIK